jgi:putative SOS response-associated peptidase YedK
MCVRYTLHKTDAAVSAISRALGHPLDTPDWATPRFNVALTSTMPVVACGQGFPEVRPMRWGLIPSGERGRPRPRILANARSETVATLPAFRKGTAGRRCLVPANGFYEWKAVGAARLPYLFTLAGEEPFAFAGIWDPAGDNLPETFCLLTTEPNALVAAVHNRMPVLLTSETMPRWIGDTPLAAEELRVLFQPLDPARMASKPLSRFVSSTRHEGPECLLPPGSESKDPEFDFGQE